jgi:two-component system sensor histidine kinase PilS (NtrC family)
MIKMDDKQVGPLLALYSYFRIVLAIILIGIAFIDDNLKLITEVKYTGFLIVSCGYLAATILLAAIHHYRNYRFSASLIFFAILADELFIQALVYFGHLFSTEISLLQAIPIAIAGMFFSGGTATVFAALATLATFSNLAHFALITEIQTEELIQGGLMGAMFFLISLVMQFVARRLRASEREVIESERQAEEMAIISRHIVQRIHTGLVIFNTDGEVILTNQAAEEHLGMRHFRHIRETPLLACYQRSLADPTLHHQLLRAGQELNEVQLTFSPLGYRDHVIAFLEGMAEISQRAQQIKLAALGRLSANIAHEIRNPLSAISHSLQLLGESPTTAAPEDQHLLEICRKHIVRINNTVANILEMSRKRQFHPEKILLADLLTEIGDEYRQQLGNSLEYLLERPEPAVYVTFDRLQLVQILNNLIDNALTFSRKNCGRPWVRLAINAEQQGPYRPASLNIFDQGPGIPAALQEKVFEPFFTTEPTGTGLGLYIARELCTLNQSSLDYIDKEGQGFFQIRFSHPDRNIFLQSVDTNAGN